MKFKNIETIFVSIFLLMTIAEFIPFAFSIRLLGMNLLNHRFWASVVVATLFISDRKIFLSKPMIVVYLYFGIYFLMESIGHYDLQGNRIGRFSWISTQHYPLAVAILLRERFMQPHMRGQLKVMMKVAFFAFLLASVTSILVIYRHPSAVRGTEISFFREDQGTFRMLGMGGYGFFSSLPFIVPIIIYRIKHTVTSSSSQTLFSTVQLLVVSLASYMAVLIAPMLLLFTALAFSWLGRKRATANLTLISILILIFLLIPKVFVGQFFMSISDNVSNTEIKRKLSDIGTTFIEGMEFVDSESQAETTVEQRASRVSINLKAFFRSPFIGAGVQGDAHLYWLNLLAQFGLLGALPMFWLTYQHIKRVYFLLSEECRFYFLLSMLTFISLGLVKTITSFLTFITVFFVVPGMFYLESYGNINREKIGESK